MDFRHFAFFLAMTITLQAKADPFEKRSLVFSQMNAFFAPEVAAQNGHLQFEISNEEHLSGEATRQGRDWKIIVTKAVLSSSRLTMDGFQLLVCHELGHLLGGKPRKPAPLEWDGELDEDGQLFLSAEGQADYYAGFECLKRVLKSASIVNEKPELKVSPVVKEKCQQLRPEDSEICERVAMAGLSFLNLTMDFPIAFETPSTEKVSETIVSSYPSRQCRLDTIFAGALGMDRPKCWFSPTPDIGPAFNFFGP